MFDYIFLSLHCYVVVAFLDGILIIRNLILIKFCADHNTEIEILTKYCKLYKFPYLE